MDIKICSICGKEFVPSHFNQTRCPGPHYKYCPICGKEIPWTEYDRCCSKECTDKKKIATSIERYGCSRPQASPQVQAKMRATCKSHYGVDYPGQDKQIRKKQVDSYRSHYGKEENPEGCASLQDKRRSTCLEKYGVTSPAKCPDVRAKMERTSLARYGVPNPAQTEEARLKMQSTMIARYGVSNCMQSEEIKKRARDSVISKYGVPYTFQLPEVREKSKQTNLKKYGVPWYCMTDECKAASGKIVSKLNRSFMDFLIESGINDSDISLEFHLGAYSFDFKVGDNLLIELDPTFTHNCAYNPFDKNDKGLSREYHINKTKLANQYGYRCIHIFDWDDWEKIARTLILSNSTSTLYARDCNIDMGVDAEECDSFLSKYHLQGTCKGQIIRLGLRDSSNQLMQLMTFGAPRYNRSYEFELLRLCSSTGVRIVGGASRLFSHFIKNSHPESIISYCDLAKFEGNVYPSLGFKLCNISSPNKVWFRNGKMITDNLLRQHGYDQLFGTNYGKGTSNEELMLSNHWLPIYDCGQKVFEWRIANE